MGKLRDRMVQDLQLIGYSPVTNRIYLHYVKCFARHYMRSPADMGQKEIRDYLIHLLYVRKLSHDAYRQAFSALKFLYSVTLRRPFEIEWIPRHRKARRLPDILSGSEVTALLKTFRKPKFRAITMTLYGAGLRVLEACRLGVADIDSMRMLIHVREGKGGKDRYVMLSQRLLEALREHWTTHRSAEFLFVGRTKSGHVSPEAVRSAVRHAAKSARLTKRVTPHLLRHSFATHLLEIGTDVTVIQSLLGHCNIRETSRYTRVSSKLIGRVRSPLDVLDTAEGEVLG